jgi:hypothetical protein
MLLPFLRAVNVGPSGILVPLSMYPMDGALPQIMAIPPEPHVRGDYFVAYSVMPGVLRPMLGFTGRRIVLFVKRPGEWLAEFGAHDHIDVRAVGPDFAACLAGARGFIGSPSRGSVMQALVAAKPVYLFLPRGHLEQRFNLRCYQERFRGVGSPERLTLAEWDAQIDALGDLRGQAAAIRAWVAQTGDRVREVLAPCLLKPRGLGRQEQDASVSTDRKATQGVTAVTGVTSLGQIRT